MRYAEIGDKVTGRKVFDAFRDVPEQVVLSSDSARGPTKDGPAETHTAVELGRRFELEAEEGREILAKAVKMGVLIPVGGDAYEAPNPSLLAVGDEAVRSGIPLRAALEAIGDVQRHCDSASRSFVRLFLREVWKPFAKEDMPVERWPDIEDAVDRLRPAASEALVTIFQERLSAQIDRALSDITHRLSERRH